MNRYREVAEWLYEKLKKQGYLYQEEAVYEILEKFGEAFIYENENGNPAINRKVLKEFRKITDNGVVWVRSEKMWRFREEGDSEGRMQD